MFIRAMSEMARTTRADAGFTDDPDEIVLKRGMVGCLGGGGGGGRRLLGGGGDGLRPFGGGGGGPRLLGGGGGPRPFGGGGGGPRLLGGGGGGPRLLGGGGGGVLRRGGGGGGDDNGPRLRETPEVMDLVLVTPEEGGGGGGEMEGQLPLENTKVGQEPKRGPLASPSKQEPSVGHQPQKGSLEQAWHPLCVSQASVVHVSKNHSVQFVATPPGPTASPGVHSPVDSHQPQPLSTTQSKQVSWLVQICAVTVVATAARSKNA